MVWRTAYRLVNHDPDAADCYQRAFLAALELERREKVRNWPALLKRLVTARALECLRQRRRETARRAALPEALVIDRKDVGPVRSAQAGELGEHLREALAHLDSQQAQVFCLVCLEELRYQEVADLLGITVNHVGVLLHRARASLQVSLQAYGPRAAAENSRRDEKP